MQPKLKIGLFSIGLEAYWPQFPGLYERLSGYAEFIANKLSVYGPEVIYTGMVDNCEKAFEAGTLFRQQDVDIIFLYVSTYALSSTVLPVVRRAKVPVIVLNLSPEAAINYEWFNNLNNRTTMTSEWLAFCQACPIPEIANVFKRSGISFFQITGVIDAEDVWAEIGEWIAATRVAHTMNYNRLGVMGNYYGGMLDIYSNFTLQCATFGGHVEVIEVDELSAIRQEVNDQEVSDKLTEFSLVFEIENECPEYELIRAARTSVALDKLAKKHRLGSFAYYYKGLGNPQNEDTMSSIIPGCSLLTAAGIPVAGEYEIKNAQAMKIMDSFGAGGSFSEYYAVDYKDDIVLFGHDGPGHLAIAEGRIKVSPLMVYHGKIGNGLSIEMSVKNGPVTLLSIVETVDGKIMFLMAEAESVAGPILKIGNTNSRYRFPIGAKKFMEDWNSHGPAHHCAIGIGHIASKIKKLGAILNLQVIQVC